MHFRIFRINVDIFKYLIYTNFEGCKMIIKAERTKINKFEIKINNELKYFSSMEKISGIKKYKKGNGIISDIHGSICYTLLPAKEASDFWGKIKYKHCIFNNINQNCGVFYKLISGFLNSKHVIEYENYKLSCYSRAVGKTQNISIYDGENQIAEIIKSIQIAEDYYIFLLDKYINLQTILSLFVSYLEFEDRHSQEATGKVGVSYTFDRNNKFYNKNWIKDNFNYEDVQLINKQIEQERKSMSNSL